MRAPNPLIVGLPLLLAAADAAAQSAAVPPFAAPSRGAAPEIRNEPLDPDLARRVAEALPEGSDVDRDFLDPSYEPTLRVSEDAQVFVTFVDEGAGYQNSLGYFSYAEGALDGLTKADADLDADGVVSIVEAERAGLEIGWAFPDATRAPGRLAPGDTVTLGDGRVFGAGTRVGFFLVQNGWDARPGRGRGTPQTFYTLDFLNPEAAAGSTLADSGVGATRHVAMLFEDASRSEIIMGFEDLNRIDPGANVSNFRSDEDFNDAVFTIRSNPVEAIRETDIATAPGPLAGSTAAGLLALLLLRRRRRRS